MKKNSGIILIFCIMLSILTACCLYAYADDTTSATEATDSTASGASVETTETSATTATTAKGTYTTKPVNSKTTKPVNKTTASAASSATSSETRSGSMTVFTDPNETTGSTGVVLTGVPNDYPNTTYRGADVNTNVGGETYTTETTDPNNTYAADSTYNYPDNSIEVYTVYGDTTVPAPATAGTSAAEESGKKTIDWHIIVAAVVMVAAIGLVVLVVTLIKKRKEFRDSLYFKFKK